MIALAILAACAVAAILFLLHFREVKNWFYNQYDVDNVETYRVVVKGRLKSGHYKTIAGVFNDRTQQIYSQTAWKSEKIDAELEAMDQVSPIFDLN